MASNLTLTLNYNDIKTAVKSDTYITGQIDKSADMVKNAALAFNEQAGDEEYHENKIFRTVKGALAKLEASLAEYVETSNSTAYIRDNLESKEQVTFTIQAVIGSRTSNAFEKPMAYLAQEFVINTALYYWWQPIKPSLAKDYLAFSAENIMDLRRCLTKSAPTTTSSYNDISGSVTPIVRTPTSLSFPQSEYNATHQGTPQTSVAWDSEPVLTKNPSNIEVTYSSSNILVANVNASTGEVALTGIGDAVITATYVGNDEYAPSSASYTIHVSSSNPFGPQP